jgi:glucosamine--fructose-6-phosphate aminotransferase (isomerizing)
VKRHLEPAEASDLHGVLLGRDGVDAGTAIGHPAPRIMTRRREVEEFRMYAQIRAQPAALERLLRAELGLGPAAEALARARRVFALGVGSSANAATAAALWLRRAGLDARAGSSFGFLAEPPALRPGDSGLVFSHRGLEQHSRRAVQVFMENGLSTIQVSGEGAPVAEGVLVLRTVALEPSPVHTLSYTGALLVAARLAATLRPGLLGDLGGVPAHIRAAIELEPSLRELAAAWSARPFLLGLGGGLHRVSASELAIKLCEAPRLRSAGHEVELFLHGLHIALGEGDAVICFAGEDRAADRTAQAASFAVEVGAGCLWIGPQTGPPGSLSFALPPGAPELAPLLEAVPIQLLAAHLAAARDVDADSFRRDEPRFERALQRLAS